MRGGVRGGTAWLAATALVAGLAVTTAPVSSATSEPAGKRGCPDVRAVWAGGMGSGLIREVADKTSVDLGDVAVRTIAAHAPQLVDADLAAIREQGLDHPHFTGWQEHARETVRAVRRSVRRCPGAVIVVGGHSEGAVAAHQALRTLARARYATERRHVAGVWLLGDPLDEERVEGWKEPGLLAGRGPALPDWVHAEGVLHTRCNDQDWFCDDRQGAYDAPRVSQHYAYDYRSVIFWDGDLPVDVKVVEPVIRGATVRIALDPERLPGGVRLSVARRLPKGMRLRHGRLVGKPPRTRTAVHLWMRGKTVAPAVRRRLTVVLAPQKPAGARGTVLVTRGVDGRPADDYSFGSLVSASGSTVAFTSNATNLVRKSLGAGPHMFAWDRETRRHELVGILPDGSTVPGTVLDMSEDGRRILFGDRQWSGEDRRWVRDRDLRTTVAVPAGSQLDLRGRVVTYPVPEPGWQYTDAASNDARYVVLTARTERPGGLDPYDVPIRVWDNRTGTVVRTGQVETQAENGRYPRKLSADGRYLVIDGQPASVVDLADGRTVASGGYQVDISDDGRWTLRADYPNARRFRLRLERTGGPGSVDLLPGRPRFLDDPHRDPVSSATTSQDGTAVAYNLYGDLVVRRDTSDHNQIYHWKAR